MTKQELIEQINEILKKVEDEKVLKDMLKLLSKTYHHYISGNWER